MSTNIGSVVLGELVLGASSGPQVYNMEVSHTITFTQSLVSLAEVIEHNITFTQSISHAKVYNRTITSVYSPSQIIKKLKYESVTSTLAWSHSNTVAKTKPVAAISTFIPAQTLSALRISNRLVVSGIEWTHTRARQMIYNRTITSVYTPVQSFVADHCKAVFNTLTFGQSISYIKSKNTKHVLEWQQEILNSGVFGRQVNQNPGIYQTIAQNVLLNKAVTSNLALSQAITVYRVLGIAQSLALSQSIVAYASRGVYNSITFSGAIGLNKISNRTVPQTLNLNQTVRMTRSHSKHVKQGFGMNQTLTKSNIHTQSINQTLALTQELCRTRHVESITNTLTLTQSVNYIPVYPETMSNTLVLNQSIGLIKTLNRNVTDILQFLPSRTVYVGMGDTEYVEVNNIQWQIVPGGQLGDYQVDANEAGMIWIKRPSRKKRKRKYCVLKTNSSAITLPSPEFNDAENYGGVFTIRRAMNGTPYTYVRNLDLGKLRLPFSLDKSKAWELREFLITNNTKMMDLLTWKGDKWLVYLLTNPTEFTVTNRRLNANEGVAVTLEFEGLKVM